MIREVDLTIRRAIDLCHAAEASNNNTRFSVGKKIKSQISFYKMSFNLYKRYIINLTFQPNRLNITSL